jgi:hypothetical protein
MSEARSKTGKAVKSLSSVTVQGPVPPHLGPAQPTSVEPAAGVAVKVTTVPVGNAATHVVPQSMPGGWLVTVPDPVPCFWMVRFDIPTGGLNVAVTDRFASIVTVQDPVPLHPSPLHPEKVEPPLAAAVRVTTVPGEKFALQVGEQAIPGGLLKTSPTPVPAFVTVSVKRTVAAVKVAVTA